MSPTPDEEYYWRWPEYKFDIPLEELGPTEAIRRRGIELIKYLPGSRDRIRKIEYSLVSLSSDPRFAHIGGDPDCWWEMYCRPALKKALVAFYEAVKEERGKKDALPIVSAYRRRGTHVIGADPSGALDATDPKGHWTGLSVDLYPAVTKEWIGGDAALDSMLARPGVGLCRPFYPERYEEKNHLTLR